jgi:hypothetical protein
MRLPTGIFKCTCPQCGNTQLGVNMDDVDAEDHFIGDPVVVCLLCGARVHASELVEMESSEGQILHMERG